MEYKISDIEARAKQKWHDHHTYRVSENPDKPKYYVLDMFPYPSGAGLHVGHPLGYIASDIFARYKRHRGFNVLHPMGYDSFGLPAEQYAIQTGQHPALTTATNIARYREQLDSLGLSFDWNREVRTSDPAYYKWTQWIFLKLYDSWYDKSVDRARPISELVRQFEKEGNAGVNAHCDETPAFSAADWAAMDEAQRQTLMLNYRIAYLSDAYVNWCPALGTVLANDEVKDGLSERGGHPVERKLMKQWSMRITAYAQRLLDGLETIDWSESLKEQQRNWIGRSEGALVRFKLAHHPSAIEVFTTRPDTIFGVSFMVLAPEHELVDTITTPEQRPEVENYIARTKLRSDRDRMADVKTVSGCFTGAYAVHPFTGAPIAVWIADYVLAGYGTGAVMAVPSGDQRDWNFARHFNLPIPVVIEGTDPEVGANDSKDGRIINSDFLSGLSVKEAIKKAIGALEEKGIGTGRINYRLRDAVFGRQRYWGEPIPIYYIDGIPYPVREEHLPLTLPEISEYLPTETGEPPLGRAKGWGYLPDKGVVNDGSGYGIELSTMPGWAGSSWYYLRYMDPANPDTFAARDKINYWQNVDLYMGGSEHATGHLLYVRFWTKFLKDLGYVPFDEPAKKLVNQGMIQGRSNFVYRVIQRQYSNALAHGDIIKFPEGSIRPLYISKDLLNLVERNSQINWNHQRSEYNFSKSPLPEVIPIIEAIENADKEEVKRLKEIYPNSNVTSVYHPPFNPHFATSWHVDVSIVHNDLLDQSAFREKYNLPDAQFLLNDEGKYLCGHEVEKMSKSKWNVVNPDDIIARFGADTLRLYEMFLGPLEDAKPWNTNGIEGTHRFLRKFWNLFFTGPDWAVTDEAPGKAELKVLHTTIRKIGEDIEKLSFNTCVSQFMICVNELTDLKCRKRAILEPLCVLLSPFAPHIAEVVWDRLKPDSSVTYAAWPEWDETHLTESEFAYPISFNGKTRFFLSLPAGMSQAEVTAAVVADAQTIKYLDGQSPKKIIVVPGRIVNVVV